jgi:probable addiction module antidote protein
MAKTTTSHWDVIDYLQSEEDQANYLAACIEEAGDDTAFIAKAIGEIARARGMSQLAAQTGLARESLYKSLSEEGNPAFSTIVKVVHALGLELHITPKAKPAPEHAPAAAHA